MGLPMRLGSCLLVTAALCWAQDCCAQDRAAFEVASVKLNPGSPDFSEDLAPSGRVTTRNVSVWNLIRWAYGVRELELSGGPAWVKSRGFDIQAQPAQSDMPVPRPQVLLMLQTLL